jgi:hypothetical protein
MLRRLLVLLALTACTEPYDPFYGAEPFSPPAIYAEWWGQTESCSGKTGDFSAVRWYTREAFAKLGTQAVADYAVQAVVMRPELVLVANDVRHEMLHLLIKQPGHPEEFFRTKCGHLVGDI